MANDVLDARAYYRDKNAGTGAAPINVLADMVPANMAAGLTGLSITGGNGAAQWGAISGGAFSPAGASVTPGTYNLTVTATYSYAAPWDTGTGDCIVIVPSASFYVDFATGNDANAGTKASPWKYPPSDPRATGNSAALVASPPVVLTMIVIKGGGNAAPSRISWKPFSANIVYAGGAEQGWGTAESILTGFDPLGVGAAVTSLEAGGNPNFANFVKFANTAWGGVSNFTASIGPWVSNDTTTGLMTVTAITSGVITVGQTLTWPGSSAVVYVTGYVTGFGGVGTYVVSSGAAQASIAMTGVSKKWLGQQILDRGLAAGGEGAGALMSAAQWPPIVGNQFTASDNPSLNLTGGMIQVPSSSVIFPGGGTAGGPGTIVEWPADLIAKMGGQSLVGYPVGLWVVPNLIRYFLIQTDDGTQGTCDTSGFTKQGDNPTAMQVLGHPRLITAVNQFAWSPDTNPAANEGSDTLIIWPTNPTALEITNRLVGIDMCPDSTSGAANCLTLNVTGMVFEGFYSRNSTDEGAAIHCSSVSDYRFNILNNIFRWCGSGNSRSGFIRTGGFGKIGAVGNGVLICGNTFYEAVRYCGGRFTTAGGNFDGWCTRNKFHYLSDTGVYWYFVVNGVTAQVGGGMFRANEFRHIGSTHGNPMTFYNDDNVSVNLDVKYNITEDCARPMTKHECAGAVIQRNLMECDALTSTGVLAYLTLPSEDISFNAFLRPRGVAGSGNPCWTGNSTGGPKNAGTYNRNVFDGLAQGDYVVAGAGPKVFPIPAGETLSINGVTVTAPVGGWANMTAVIAAINAAAIPNIAAFNVGNPKIQNTGPGQVTIGVASQNHNLGWDVAGSGFTVPGTYLGTFTNNLITQLSTNRYAIEHNVGLNTGNSVALDTRPWNGALTGEMRKALQKGRIGDQMITGWSVITFPDKVNQLTSTLLDTGWCGPLDVDAGTKTITLSGVAGAQISVANDAIGTGATAPAGSATGTGGKYIKIFQTSAAAFSTKQTVNVDFGDGSVYAWSVTTARAFPWCLLNTVSADLWQTPTTGPTGPVDTTGLTLAIPFGPFTTPASSGIFWGVRTGNLYYQLQMLSTRKARLTLKSSANALVAGNIDIALPATPVLLVLAVDLTKPVAATLSGGGGAQDTDGIQAWFFDNVSGWARQTLTGSVGTWVQNGTIGYTGSIGAGANRLGGASMNNWAGLGMWPAAADLSTAALRNKFCSVQMGYGGFQNPLAVDPLFAMFGTEAGFWDSPTAKAGGINLSPSGPKLKWQTGTAPTPAAGGSTVWPAYTYAATTVLAAAAGPAPQVGVASNHLLTFDNPIGAPKLVTFSDRGQGGTFTPASVTVQPGDDINPLPDAVPFTYTPAVAGPIHLDAAASGLATGTLLIAVASPTATAYSISGASSAIVGSPFVLTFTLNGPNPSGVTFDIALSGPVATLSQNPLLLTAGETAADLTVIPAGPGTLGLTPTNGEGLTDPSPFFVVVSAQGGGGASGVFNPKWDPKKGRRGQRS